jgi:Na+-transporting methylmalonyl-CoA/oxaloacetate decarboxylase gamma subunit
MRRITIFAASLLFAVGAFAVPNADADPCGMVPPIYTGSVPITRIGLQKTYVFYKDGVESFVIRPGFQGSVEEFGMLIPFPTPPELRKVPDNTFGQIVNALDPPEVVVDLRIRRRMMRGGGGMAPAAAEGVGGGGLQLQKNKVVVLKEEAVGMYEVAVLEAGSAEALKIWMEEHKYQYPKGMDKVAEEYIESGWCFVAVKSKVGGKADVEPAAGKRSAKTSLPSGSVFDGHVQGMGFRFKTDEFVVPMRLSAFNGGDMRNIVYILADSPRRIRSIPEEYVQRQVSGEQLVKNMTQPLPLRIIGGTEKDIPQGRRASIDQQRKPGPKNGIAKDLFASDLLAVSTGELSLRHEEQEKDLLQVGEHFGLRGKEIDDENALALAEIRNETTEAGIELLANMTLTVVDGDFPREVVARENLTFANYDMPPRRNRAESYDSKLFGPGSKKEGILKVGSVDWKNVDQQIAADELQAKRTRGTFAWLVSFAAIGMVLTLTVRRRAAALAILIVCIATSGAVAGEFVVQENDSIEKIVENLKETDSAKEAIAAAVELAKSNDDQRDGLIKALLGVAKSGEDLPQRGWSIAALAEIGGTDVDEYLLDLHADETVEKVVRTWAAAARVSMTRSVNGLIEKAQLIQTFPALGRPIGIRLVEKMSSNGEEVDPEQMIQATIRVPQLQQSLAPAIIAFGPEKLGKVLYGCKDNNVRRTAAGYMGTLANAGQGQEVADQVISAVAFDPQANNVPWDGGALFIPNIQWDKENSQALVGNLIRWHVWCDMNDKAQEQQQIHNNIRSVALVRAAGYSNPGWQNVGTVQWLNSWKAAVGQDGIRKVLEDAGALDAKKYQGLLR